MFESTDALCRGEENLCSIESGHVAQQASPAPFIMSSRDRELESVRCRVDELQQQVAQPPSAGTLNFRHSPLVIGVAEEPASLQTGSSPQSEQQLETWPGLDNEEDTCDPVLQNAASIL